MIFISRDGDSRATSELNEPEKRCWKNKNLKGGAHSPHVADPYVALAVTRIWFLQLFKWTVAADCLRFQICPIQKFSQCTGRSLLFMEGWLALSLRSGCTKLLGSRRRRSVHFSPQVSSFGYHAREVGWYTELPTLGRVPTSDLHPWNLGKDRHFKNLTYRD